jgi:MFS family permease
MPEEPLDRSYRALFRVPGLGRVVTSMTLARIAQSMVGVAIVLFVLAEYHSPALAGIVTFASIFPGLVIAPIAGALLDRHGRVRLMILDYVVALVSLALIGVLALADLLPPWLLVLITIVTSLTSILSVVGLRTLYPIMAPQHLWERVNAVDSNGYVVATILGPPLAAALVVVLGAPEAMIAIAIPFGLAAGAILGLKEPRTANASTGRLFYDAWQGVRYAWSNRTIRGLGFSLSVVNLAWGTMTILIPIVILDVLHLGAEMVGLVFAVSGVSGMVSAIFFGRFDTRGREWRMFVIPMLLMPPTVLIMLPATGALGPIEPMTGFALLALAMFIFGLLNGCADIALFTVRQRRTDPAWMGRAFAVSMAFNFMGFPIGAAIAGAIVTESLGAAVIFATIAALVGAVLAALLVPATAQTFEGVTHLPAEGDLGASGVPEVSG